MGQNLQHGGSQSLELGVSITGIHRWAKYHPRRGLGVVQRFMEKEGRTGEKNRTSHWFDVPEGYALECLVIGDGEQRCVYVVTTEAPAEYAWIHDRWPLLTTIGGKSGSC